MQSINKEANKFLKTLVSVFQNTHQKTHVKRVESLLGRFPEDKLPKHLKKSIQTYYNLIQKNPNSIKLLAYKEKVLTYADSRISSDKTSMRGGGKKTRDDLSETNQSDLLIHLQKFLGNKHDNHKTE